MRGLDFSEAAEAAAQEDDKFYIKRLKEIVESHPNKGPPSTPTRLLPHLYIGSQRNADDVAGLQRLGITHILNCASSRRLDLTKSPRDSCIKGYLTIPAEDHEDFNIMRFFPEAIAFLEKVKNCHGRALVHCNLGVNRSGAVCAAYLMVESHMSLLEAIQYLKTKRSVVLYNKGFRRQLLRFARNKGFVDPIIQTSYTEQPIKQPNTSPERKSAAAAAKHQSRSRDPSPASTAAKEPSKLPNRVPREGLSISRSASTESDTSTGRKSLKFGARLFKRYGRSLSNNDVEKVSKLVKAPSDSSPSPSHKSLNGPKKGDAMEASRFARSFLTLGGRSSPLLPGEGKNDKERKMDIVPENLPLESFGKIPLRKRTPVETLGSMERNERMVKSYQDTGFSTSLLPGSRNSEEEEAELAALSTSRPLRVYRRSATDSEVYRSKRQAAAAAATTDQHKHSQQLHDDRLSPEMNALSIRSRTLPSSSRTPRHLLEIPKPRMRTLDFS